MVKRLIEVLFMFEMIASIDFYKHNIYLQLLFHKNN